MRISHKNSSWLHKNFAPLKLRALKFRVASHTHRNLSRVSIELRHSKADTAGSIIEISKNSRNQLEVEMDRGWLHSKTGFSTAWRRIGAFIDILSTKNVPPGRWRVDLGDWVTQDGPVAGFCSAYPQTTLFPDRGFTNSAGYMKQRYMALQGPHWFARKPCIVWRGGPNGHGLCSKTQMDWRDQTIRQRVRLCLLSQQLQNADHTLPIDCAITPSPRDNSLTVQRLREVGIVGTRVPSNSWLQYQFAIDIDGNANAFTNFFTRLLFGCCILKISSPYNFQQWYYHRLKPWVHFIPVATNLSNLEERIRWCFDHPHQCYDIARAGQALAFSATYRQERRYMIKSLAAATI